MDRPHSPGARRAKTIPTHRKTWPAETVSGNGWSAPDSETHRRRSDCSRHRASESLSVSQSYVVDQPHVAKACRSQSAPVAVLDVVDDEPRRTQRTRCDVGCRRGREGPVQL